MRKVNDFLLAILAGSAISFGGTVFLSLESKVLGSLFFAIGLFMVCTLKLNLFTGKACYLPGKDLKYVGFLCLVWVGNLVGAQIVASLLKLTRVGPVLAEKAAGICQIKMDDTLVSLFILGVFCNIMIYVGVESYMANEHPTGKYLGIILEIRLPVSLAATDALALLQIWSFCSSALTKKTAKTQSLLSTKRDRRSPVSVWQEQKKERISQCH